MAQQQNSSRSILIVTIVVAILLIVVIWPLSQLGKGNSVKASDSDEAAGRIQPVATLELAKAPVAQSDGKPRDGATALSGRCRILPPEKAQILATHLADEARGLAGDQFPPCLRFSA
jgi:hypothetical protein